MEHEVTSGERVLNGFLSVMVIILIGILLSVVVAMILWAVGVF